MAIRRCRPWNGGGGWGLLAAPLYAQSTWGAHGEGKADISAQYPAAPESARVPYQDANEERPARPEAASGEGTEAAHGQQRVEPARLEAVAERQQFRPHERLRRHGDFQRVYERGVRLRGRFATIFVLPNGGRIGRLGIAATRRLGGAVRRNRAKRLIREIFRHNKMAPGFDLVVVPRPELLEADPASLEADYRNTLARHFRRRR